MRDFSALCGFIAARETVPFAWGRNKNDCVAYVAGAIKAMTGEDRASGLRWASAASGIKLAEQHGGLASAVSARLRSIAPAAAHRGDVAGVPDPEFPGGVRLMIVEGEMLVGPGEHGNRRQRRAAMTMAWSAD